MGTSKKTGKKYQNQDFVIETNGNYPQIICFTTFKPEMLDGCRVGDTISVDFELRSTESNGRYYTNASAIGVSNLATMGAQERMPNNSTTKKINVVDDNDDDLPF